MRTVKLEDICLKVCSGGTPSSKIADYYNPPIIPWLTTSEVNYSYIYTTKKCISENGLNNSSAKLIPINSVIVAMYGQGNTAGRVAINKIPLATNQACCNLIINPELADYRFVYYVLSAKYNELVALKNGGAQPNLNAKKIREFEIPFPPRNIQGQIAVILSSYDEMIDNCKAQIALLEEAAQRLYREWFVDLRFPGHETTPIGENGYPYDWHETKLGNITSKFATGLNPRKNFVLGKGTNFYVTIKNLTQTYVVLDDKCDKIDDEALKKINRRSDLKAGDLLFSGIGTIGRVAFIFDTPTNWNISESLFTIRPNDLVSSEYLYLLLSDSGLQGYAHANSQGSAQKGIRMAALKSYSFVLPSDKVLKKFNYVIKPYFKGLNTIHKMLNYYVETRSYLLPRLISGQIEIKE